MSSLADRSEWLAVVLFAALLAGLLSVQGLPASRERAAPSDTAVCEKLPFVALNLFVLH
jgi:hypothetical protein